ncbi:MAG TPA: pyrroloquinoline quinone biosynthesis peptide chaperone PqqD [Gammaproteobacteria bacterium]|jgi:pyrroloquinoline quinone biosynthesis protein D
MNRPLDTDMPELAPTFRFQWEEAQNCWVILYPEGMVKLSPTAGEIMKRCDGKSSVAAIVAGLEAQYSANGLSSDVRTFLEAAREHGWIRYRAD